MFFEYGLFFVRFITKILIHRILKSDLERELFIALKENEILKRKLKRKVEITCLDRAFYVGLYQASKSYLKRLIVVKPETIIG